MKRKFLSVLLALVLVSPLAPVLCPVSAGSPTTIYVPGDYATIQAAVDAASAGDIIRVAAGTYTENVQVDEQLTLIGDTSRPYYVVVDAGGRDNAITLAANGCVVQGFTVQNGERGIYLDHCYNSTLTHNIANSNTEHGICLDNSVNATLTSNIANSNTESGIYLDNSDGNTLTNNIANSNTKCGIYLDGNAGSHGNTLTGNTANENGEFGIYIDDCTNNTLTNNIANSNTRHGIYLDGAAGSNGNTLTGNTANQNSECGVGIDHGNNNTLTSNSVIGNDTGVNIGALVNASTISINLNKICSNTQYGMQNSGSGTANATNNWWGDNSGPSHASNPSGTGDTASGNVNYDPWHKKQISALTAGNANDSSIDLSWTTTETWSGDYFDVRYSTSTITLDNWGSASRATREPTPSTSTASQGMRVSRLSRGTTYYFGLRLIDGDVGLSDISNIASATTLTTAAIDNTAPSVITDLAASAGTPTTTSVILSWTAKGDDGTSGIASGYLIKQSTSNITADNFDSATTVYNNLPPKANGESESFTVSRLSRNTTYYFAVKVQDEASNTSAMSNVVSITTSNLLPTVTGISPTTGDNGEARILTISGTNFTSSGTTVVRFISDDNTFDLTTVIYASSTQLTGVVPIGAPTGTYKAKVINNYGTSALSSATYTVAAAAIPLPAVTNVLPYMGTSDAATPVRIFGENLTGASAVTLDDESSTSLTGTISVSTNGTAITGLSIPSGIAAGEYNVKVTTAAGTNVISTVKFRVSEPVVINTDTTEDTTTSEVIDLGDTNVTPVQLTLTTDTAETATLATDTDAAIEVVIPPETTVTDSEGDDYTGSINPPRVVKADESVLSDLTEAAMVIEMGNPEETIRFDQDFVATITLTASHQPLIWYYNKTTLCYELAGKTGTKDGVSYIPGGVVINQAGTLYTIGLLLDHMSPYVDGVVSTVTGSPAEAPDGTNITITGTNFDEGQAQVYFNETQGTVVSRTTTQVVATVPKFIYREHSTDYILKVRNRDGQYDTTSIRLLNVPALTQEEGTISVVGTLFGTVPGFPISASGKVVKTIIAASADGNLSITIPAGTTALDKYGNPLSTLMSNVDPSLPQPPEGANIIGAAYDFGPPGTTFDPPIIFECTYDPAEIPEGVAEEDLVLAHYDEEAGEWVELPSTVDPVTHTVTASVCHFSTFAIIARAPAALPPAPAVFSVSSLSTQPVEVQPEEAVNIRVSVANTGGTAGSYTVVLMIDGVKEAEKSVTVADGSSQGVSFSVTRGDAGSYSVAVDGLSSSFVVVAPPAASPPAESPINWLLLGGVIGGVIVVSLAIFVVRRRAY